MKKFTESWRKHLREGQQRYWSQPGTKEKQSALIKQAMSRPEIQEKLHKPHPWAVGKKHSQAAKDNMRRAHLGKKRGPYSKEYIVAAATALVTHHWDFDHDNDFDENRREMTRSRHNSIHRLSGKMATVFIKNAMDKGIVTKEFYEQFLSYINQEDNCFSETNRIVGETTPAVIS